MSRNMRWLLTASVLVVALVLAACGTPAPPPPEETPAPGAPTPTPVPPTPTKGVEEEPIVFTFSVPYEIPNLDPSTSWDFPSEVVLRSCYDSLVRLRGDPVEVQPSLAESWDVGEDLTEWTFHLVDNAVFHDGSPVTAEAVAYTFERMMALESGVSWMWADITDENTVSVLDDYTVRFTLTEPFAAFPSTLGYLWIINPALAQEHEEDGDWGSGWLLDHEAGSGPYTVSRWEPGVMYEMGAVPDYWGGWPHETSADVMRYMVYREAAPARLALESGELDWVFEASEEDVTLLEGKEGFTVVNRPSLTMWHIWMNTASEGPLGDPNVRKAIAYAFDYSGADRAVINLLSGNSYVPGSLPGAVEFEDLQRTDLDLAKEYLARSAWPDGGFEIDHVYIADFAPEEDIGLVFLDSLAKLNITVNLVPKTWGEMGAMCSDPATIPDTINIADSAAYPDPYSMLYLVYGPTGQLTYSNCHQYVTDEVANLLAEARQEADDTRRLEIYEEIQQIIHDARPAILMGYFSFIEAHNDHWQTDVHTPLWAYVGYAEDFYYVP